MSGRKRIKTSYGFIIARVSGACVEFLLVSRRRSVGYVDFVRGEYDPDDDHRVLPLFSQMTSDEVSLIALASSNDVGFEALWNDLWGGNRRRGGDKTKSEAAFDFLKWKKGLNLEFIVNNIDVSENVEEWGFPKGRKNTGENAMDCALRELEEETGYSGEDIVVLSEIGQKVESLVGTNGNEYRYVYYVALLDTRREPVVSDKREIGRARFFARDEAICTLREHHLEKRRILAEVAARVEPYTKK